MTEWTAAAVACSCSLSRRSSPQGSNQVLKLEARKCIFVVDCADEEGGSSCCCRSVCRFANVQLPSPLPWEYVLKKRDQDRKGVCSYIYKYMCLARICGGGGPFSLSLPPLFLGSVDRVISAVPRSKAHIALWQRPGQQPRIEKSSIDVRHSVS